MTPAPSTTAIPVFYRPEMVAPDQSLSPSPSKPEHAVRSWQRLGLPIVLRAPAPATRAQLALAHTQDYVDGVLDLQRSNGFGNRDPAIAASLPFTSGAMIAAAEAALASGGFAVAPVSGFHHAHHGEGGGFCTFNGLVVAARVLQFAGRVHRVGIIDFDHHYGDGTQAIIDTLKLGWIEHYSSGREYRAVPHAAAFLAAIPGIVAGMRRCDLLLYQAGADPHFDDPMGGWLTTEQLYERDLAVFEHAARWRLPVAWNLAGGYQKPLRRVLDLHDNTLRACVRVACGATP